MSEKEGNKKSPKQFVKIFTDKLGFANSFRATITKSDITFSIIIIFILSLISTFYIWVLANADALKALIEAEATVLGFFGLMAVYWLTSMDSRIDRLEQEKHEYEMKEEEVETASVELVKPTRSNILVLKDRVTNLGQQIDGIQSKKESVASEASIIGASLVISLVAEIGLLGFQSTYADALKNLISWGRLVGFFAGIPMMLFLESTWFIFSLLRRMGKKSKQEGV